MIIIKRIKFWSVKKEISRHLSFCLPGDCHVLKPRDGPKHVSNFATNASRKMLPLRLLYFLKGCSIHDPEIKYPGVKPEKKSFHFRFSTIA